MKLTKEELDELVENAMEEEWEESEDEITPEDCWTGGVFSPGTEECEFCLWADVCADSLRKAVEKR